MIRSLWRYRSFILASIRGDLRGRFARSSLGALWFILHPLAQALIFSIVLAEVLGARLPHTDVSGAYPIYLLSGVAAWGLFSEILTRSMTVFIEHSAALKKIAFPRLCLPVITWGSALVNHVLLLLAIMLIFSIFFGHYPGWSALAVLLGMGLISLVAFGLGVFLGILNVFTRDVGQVMAVVLQLWFWMTPIVYPASIVPERFKAVIAWNPMTPLVAIYQDALLLDAWPRPWPLVSVTALGLAMAALSFLVFRRASADLVDEL